MKIKPLENVVVNCRTEEEEKALMIIYELNGWKWFSRDKPTESSYFKRFGKESCYRIEDRFVYDDIDSYKEEGFKILSFKEFLDYAIDGKLPIKEIIEVDGRKYKLMEDQE